MDYKQPRYSVQLCWLMQRNLINTLDAMEYAEIAGSNKMSHMRGVVLARIEDLYNRRGGPILSDKLVNPGDIFVEHEPEFQKIFGTPLKDFVETYRVGRKLFDIVKFDEWLGGPEDASMDLVIRERYGVRGAQLIKHLI